MRQKLIFEGFSERVLEGDPCRTRTCNPWLRGPMPYPLGQQANNSFLSLSSIFGILALQADIGVNVGCGVRAPARPLVACFLAIAGS